MGALLEVVIAFFTEDNWNFHHEAEGSTIRLRFQGDQHVWDCAALVLEEQDQLVFYSVCPVNTPEPLRHSVGEYLTRVNWGLAVGNFELDLEDGQARFKTSIDVEGDRLSFALVRRLVYTNVLTMNRYLPGLLNVIAGRASPRQALAEVEG